MKLVPMIGDKEEIARLEREFPGWKFYRGVNYLCYGRSEEYDPELKARGEDWVDLRDEVIRAISAEA